MGPAASDPGSPGSAEPDSSKPAKRPGGKRPGGKRPGGKRKRGRDPSSPVPATVDPVVTGTAPGHPAAPGRTPLPDNSGQRLYDMPFSSAPARLTRPELGLRSLVARAGENAAYAIDVTLLDAPDHRLIRAGVLFAHRVLDGRGEWYLTAPDWAPLLPQDRIEPMGHADLPEGLTSLIAPLRRRATLGPVAALHCDRREFALRGDSGDSLALLRDDKVTVRRGGLTTARYREVTLTPVGAGLDADQRAFVDRAFAATGANRVAHFPRLVTRLGAPATGPSDVPAFGRSDVSSSLRRFVSTLIGTRLWEIVHADLAVRGGDPSASVALLEQATGLRAELAGLADALDPDWAEDVADDIDWLIGAGPQPGGTSTVADRLRRQRYLALLEQLVGAARAPRLRLDGSRPAAAVLAGLVSEGTARLCAVADDLTADSDGTRWERVREQLGSVRALLVVAGPVLPEETGDAVRRLAKPVRLLEAVDRGGPPAPPDLTVMSVAEAFEAGRALERAEAGRRAARQRFVDRWAKTAPKLAR